MYFQRCIDCVDIASCSSATGRQTTLRWQKQVFIHTRLSHAYLALASFSCFLVFFDLLFVAVLSTHTHTHTGPVYPVREVRLGSHPI